MIRLPAPPRLATPSTDVRTSYLVGELADSRHRGRDTAWLEAASEDFDAFVADHVGVREHWGVPSEVFWYTSGEFYLGTLVVRHELIPGGVGGHIGYHVVYPWRRQGFATAMLPLGLAHCRALGIDRALLTVAPDNAPSLAVVRRAGGVEAGINDEGEVRLWIDTSGYGA